MGDEEAEGQQLPADDVVHGEATGGPDTSSQEPDVPDTGTPDQTDGPEPDSQDDEESIYGGGAKPKSIYGGG